MKKYILPLILILCLAFTTNVISLSYTSQYPTQDTDHVKATTTYDPGNYYPHFATDPTKSLTGGWILNSWITYQNITDQRFHIDLGSAKIVRRIYYENQHTAPAPTTDAGVQNFTFWGSNTGAGTFDDLVYANDEGWTELTVAQNTFDIHSAADEADPKYIVVTNTTAYRYYALKFADNYSHVSLLGVRRIELQTEDGYTPPVTANAIMFGMAF